MRRHFHIVLALLLLAACAQPAPVPVASNPPPAPPAPPPEPPELPEQQGFQTCVPYARAVSGIEIFGDAWTWWQAADGHYARGPQPRTGAVLVWKRDERLTSGHVAVVTDVVNPREIRITHANWGYAGKPRGQVDNDVSVIDVSPANDWSEVQVWNGDSYGRTYPAHGFIYPGDGGQTI